MNSTVLAAFALVLLAGCGGDDTAGGTHGAPADAASDATSDAIAQDTGSQESGGDAAGDAPGDASDGGCPAAWLAAPLVDPTLDVPDGGGGVIFHAAAGGTQDYQCQQVATDGGSAYAWKFVGPEADLSDCNAVLVGHHFASDAGPTAPEWQGVDGTYVIGKKVHAFTPDGGAGSVPWLLLQATSTGGSGTLASTLYVQRVNTDGGVAPAATCDGSSVGTTQKVPYGADYFFFGP